MKKERKERRKPSLGTAVMWRVVVFVLGAWLICMGYLTVMVARITYLDYVNQVNTYVHQSEWYDYNWEKDYHENQSNKITRIRDYSPNTPKMEIPIYTKLKQITHFLPHLFSSLPDKVGYETEQWSVTLYDSNSNLIMGADNHVYLTYRNYYKGPATSLEDYLYGYTVIDLNRTECSRAMMKEWKERHVYSDQEGLGRFLYRFTGYFDGGEFVLLRVEIELNNDRWSQNWQCIYDCETDYEGDTVVIYPAEMCFDTSDCIVSLQNRKWELEELGADWAVNGGTGEKYKNEEIEPILSNWRNNSNKKNYFEKWNSNNLFESIITRSGYYIDHNGKNCEFVIVLRVKPIQVAMAHLAEVYILTFIFIAMILFFFCRRIRRELINPLGHILRYQDLDHAVPLYRMMPKYREPLGLLKIFNQAQEDIHELKKKNTQLETALEYAKNADENRRRMVSNITHELKTPLAVIHSYAEGLKEGIAADKQEHYLSVILEETQRMDGMVLEMLDLSRLEAGKVRLATDQFCLLELTKRVVKKLDLLIEEKDLKVVYVRSNSVEITADEGRIAQAVTNLVSNAIKYSPRGSTVYISVTKAKKKTMFAIENECEALSDEALTNVWESFYRTDPARTEKGTGLGLPITKAIIELHGGSCQVSNTSTGVEFKFYLP